MTDLPPELKKAERTSKAVFETALDYVDHWSNEEQHGYEIRYNEKENEKWLPSSVVASFLENAEKEIKEIYLACNDERVWEIQARIGSLGKKLTVFAGVEK